MEDKHVRQEDDDTDFINYEKIERYNLESLEKLSTNYKNIISQPIISICSTAL